MCVGWDMTQCILFGCILSATDPVAVVALLKELGARLEFNLFIGVKVHMLSPVLMAHVVSPWYTSLK